MSGVASEADHDLAAAPLETSVRIDGVGYARGAEGMDGVEVRRELHVFRHLFGGPLRIFFQFRFKHLQRRQRVRFGGMGVVEALPAEFFISRLECTRFHLAIEIIRIHDPAFFRVEFESGALELFHEHRNVELDDVVAAEVTVFKIDIQALRDLAERRCAPDVVVIDPVNRGRLFRNMHFGIDPAGFDFAGAVGKQFDNGNFHDPVGQHIGAGGFEIEEHQRFVFDDGKHCRYSLHWMFEKRFPRKRILVQFILYTRKELPERIITCFPDTSAAFRQISFVWERPMDIV